MEKNWKQQVIAYAESFESMDRVLKGLPVQEDGMRLPFLQSASLFRQLLKEETEEGMDFPGAEKVLKKLGIEIEGNVKVRKERNRRRVYLRIRSGSTTCILGKSLGEALGNYLGYPLEPGEGSRLVIGREWQEYCLLEQERFGIRTGAAWKRKEGEIVSGDNFASVCLDTGERFFALSDGMGSGEKADRESQAMVELMEQMLNAGFPWRDAIELLNAVFLLRKGEPRVVTLDGVIFNGYTGVMDFLKAGAMPSFLKRGRSVEKINGYSLPLGILSSVDLQRSIRKCYGGELLVMVTDGILDSFPGEEKEDILLGLLSKMREMPPGAVARKILRCAAGASGEIARDDMTVLVAQVVEKGRRMG